MEPCPPRLYRQQCLRVLTATAASLVVEVDGTPYYVTCWPRRDNPPAAGPLRPGHSVRVYNAPAPGGATLVERLTLDGARDGCTYLLRDYDRVVTEEATAGFQEPYRTFSGGCSWNPRRQGARGAPWRNTRKR